VLEQVSALLSDRFGIYFSTIQIEQRCRAGEEAAAEIDIMRALARP
jgi:cobalt-zinc-cadmium efflux system protein